MNTNIYINSFEGAQIWEHMNKGKQLKQEYLGMLAFSQQLEKLKELGIKSFTTKKQPNKLKSRDIINVKFKWSVDNTDELKDNRQYQELLNSLSSLKDEKKGLTAQIRKIKSKKNSNTTELNKQLNNRENAYKEIVTIISQLKEIKESYKIKAEDLRTLLYRDGFTITYINKEYKKNKETGEKELIEIPIKIDYIVALRSSAKSRTGQVLFINKKHRDKIVKYGRMGLKFEDRTDIDFPSLLSYESLIGSASEDRVVIDPNNILLVDDVLSEFPIDCNIVEKDTNGKLVSNPVDNYIMQNSLFDGEGLASVELFKKANRSQYGMMLLREHMFKCCVFQCDIQEFLRQHCPEDIDYNEWQLTDMFEDKIFAKDIEIITTPSSIKSLKFSKIKDGDDKNHKKKDDRLAKKSMWEHWKKKVNDENDNFYIVKSEHPSKRGCDNKGKILNQTSYQILDSMLIDKTNMKALCDEWETGYINNLKNDISTYVKFLRKENNEMNCNNMLADLIEYNKEIIHTQQYKTKHNKDVHNYIEHAKKGKIRLNADYCTIIQNGKEFLYHAIGQLPVNSNDNNELILDCDEWKKEMILEKNQCYTKLHPFDKEYVVCRNPHTAQSNVLILKNINSEFIETYFKFTNNIVYTNAINFPINRILSGQDCDSDTIIIFNSDVLLRCSKQVYGKYRICENGVPKDNQHYKVCTEDMSKIDNILSQSQKNIGKCVNTGAIYLATYWDLKNKGDNVDEPTLKKLQQGIDIATILSEICIDSAKRLYKIDMKEQIDYLASSEVLPTQKPLFFKYVSQDKKIKNKIKHFDCPMDYLQDILSTLDNKIKDDTNIYLEKLLDNNIDDRKVKQRQLDSIIEKVEEMINDIKSLETRYNDDDNLDDAKLKEKYAELDNIKSDGMYYIKHYKITKETMHKIINQVFCEKKEFKYKLELLNALYEVNRDEFLKVFKKGK